MGTLKFQVYVYLQCLVSYQIGVKHRYDLKFGILLRNRTDSDVEFSVLIETNYFEVQL